jgi:hypothetical protein
MGSKVKQVSPAGFCKHGYEISDIMRARSWFTTGKKGPSRGTKHFGISYSATAIKLICFRQINLQKLNE